jgi:hypothetical protein
MASPELQSRLKRVTSELEKAALILACETVILKEMGHAKAAELDKLRSKLNGVIRSLYGTKPNPTGH